MRVHYLVMSPFSRDHMKTEIDHGRRYQSAKSFCAFIYVVGFLKYGHDRLSNLFIHQTFLVLSSCGWNYYLNNAFNIIVG